jgi:hypothetical protein
MTDQDKLAAVVDLNDNEILVYKDTTVVDKALFVGGKDLDSVKFENTTDAPKLWKATDENGPYTHGSLPECLKPGWRLEVGAVKYPITVRGQGATKSMHPLDEEEFYHPSRRQKVGHIRWLPGHAGVLEISTAQSTYHLFGVNDFLDPLGSWIKHLNHPVLLTQQKALLFVDGAVKSGKTTVCHTILPFLLRDKKIVDEDFCFAYLDMRTLAGVSNTNGKWKKVYFLLKDMFKNVWEDVDPTQELYVFKVRSALRALKSYEVEKWIIVLDEYHFIFDSLSVAAMATMAEEMKEIVLDNDSPCYFVLAGSTQATFWWAIDQTRPNGLNMMTGASFLTTPWISSDTTLVQCINVLTECERIRTDICMAVLDSLSLSNVASLCQTARRVLTGDSQSVGEAHTKFIASKMEVSLISNSTTQTKCNRFTGEIIMLSHMVSLQINL